MRRPFQLRFPSERGIAIRQGWRALRAELPRALAMTDKLTPRMVHLVEDLAVSVSTKIVNATWMAALPQWYFWSRTLLR